MTKLFRVPAVPFCDSLLYGLRALAAGVSATFRSGEPWSIPSGDTSYDGDPFTNGVSKCCPPGELPNTPCGDTS